MGHAAWLEPLVNPEQLKKISSEISQEILKYKEIEALVVMGTSGCVIGSAVSEKTGLPLMIVRKTLRNVHSSFMIECSRELDREARKRNIVVAMVDDLISTGSTVRKVREKIAKQNRLMDFSFSVNYVFLYGCRHPLGFHRYFDRKNVPIEIKIVPVGNACYIADMH